MRAGDLNRRVRIERRAAKPCGESIEWELVSATWANVRFLSGREVIAGDAPISRVSASVRLRYRKGIREGMRVTIDDLILRIEAVLPDLARREHIDLVCVSDER